MQKTQNKKWKRFFSLTIMTLLITCILTACGVNKLLGEYHASVSFRECITETALLELKDQGLETLEELSVVFRLTLNEDQTFRISVDQDSLKNELYTTLKSAITTIFQQKWTEIGISEDQFDALARQNGYDGFDKFVDAYIAELNVLVDSSLEQFDLNGTWTKEKKLLDLNGIQAEIQKDRSIVLTLGQDDGSIDLVFEKNE